ncbi:Protein of unknown function DUF3342 [Phytophthora cactorum]|nr:Protein of unknown function DUF3342 [Phytophthora cactorum]
MKSSTKLLSSAAMTNAVPASSSSRNVVIHVFDEYRKSSKEFTCQRDLLLAKMKYFQAYLNEANEHDEIDISVHCDVEIFELLVEYMHQRDHEWQPRITLDNIASILVSSEFLQMEELVEECVAFISGRVQEFMLLRVDFGCLSDATVAKIANNCTPEQLQTLHDPKDKILSKLRRKKVEVLVKNVQDSGRRLELCMNCELFFIKGDRDSVGCHKGKRQIGVHGELVGRHEAKTGWQVETFLRDLGVDKSMSWNAAYWYIWGVTKYFHCSVCKHRCSLLELEDCAYHPGTIVGHGPAAKYSCCSARIFSADEISMHGCKTTAHVAIDDDRHSDVSRFSNIVTLPGMWEKIHACEKVARAQGSPSSGDAGGGGRIDVSSLFPPPQPKKDVTSAVERELSSRKLNAGGEGGSSGYRKQCKRPLRDTVVRCHVGNLRVSGVMARNVVEEVSRRWGLPLASEGTKLWGEYMAGTAMLSSFFKGEERVKMMVKTPNIQELYVEGMAVGEVRGKAVYVDQSLAGAPERGGHMHVSKILYGAAKPYNTSIEASGVPELDWQRFFDVSEQVPTIVRIDSEADEDHTRSCGLIIQKMPPTEAHERHYELNDLAFDKLPFYVAELKKNTDLLEYLNELIPGADITDTNCKRVPLDYYCRCSKDNYAQRLKDMGATDLKQIAADVGSAGVDLTCHFCNDAHHFSADELAV